MRSLRAEAARSCEPFAVRSEIGSLFPYGPPVALLRTGGVGGTKHEFFRPYCDVGHTRGVQRRDRRLLRRCPPTAELMTVGFRRAAPPRAPKSRLNPPYRATQSHAHRRARTLTKNPSVSVRRGVIT